MICIVLRDGRVLQYNEAGACRVESGTISLWDSKERFLVARIPLDVVERAEWSPPCAIWKDTKRNKRRLRKY